MAIQVYDHGKQVCLLHREELAPQDGATMQLLSVNIDNKDINVLYFFDMDYGIVVDKHTADMMNGKIDKLLEEGNETHNKINKDITNGFLSKIDEYHKKQGGINNDKY